MNGTQGMPGLPGDPGMNGTKEKMGMMEPLELDGIPGLNGTNGLKGLPGMDVSDTVFACIMYIILIDCRGYLVILVLMEQMEYLVLREHQGTQLFLLGIEYGLTDS